MAFKTGNSIIDETDRQRGAFGTTSFPPSTAPSGQTSLFSQSPADTGNYDFGNNDSGNGYGRHIAAADNRVVVWHSSAEYIFNSPINSDGDGVWRYGILFIYDTDGNEIKRVEIGATSVSGSRAEEQGLAVGCGVIALGLPIYNQPISPNRADDSRSFANSGAVHLYSYNGHHIKTIQPDYDQAFGAEIQSNTNEPASVEFGYSVALGDGLLVVGTPLHQGSSVRNRGQYRKDNRGTVYVYNLKGDFLFELEPPGYPFTDRGVEHSSDANMWFGQNVAVGNGVIAVAAPYADSLDINNDGKIFLYDLNGRFLKVIRPPDDEIPSGSGWGGAARNVGYNGLRIANGRIYVSSSPSATGRSIDIFDMEGNFINQIDGAITTNLSSVWGHTIVAGSGKLVIPDFNYSGADTDHTGRILICDRDGTLLTTVNNPYVGSGGVVDFNYFGRGVAITKDHVYAGIPRFSNNFTGYVYKRPLQTTVNEELKYFEDVTGSILASEAFADSDRYFEAKVPVTYHVIGGGGSGSQGEAGNVAVNFSALEGGDGEDSWIKWGHQTENEQIISAGGRGGDDNTRDRSEAGESSNWLGITLSGGAGGTNSDTYFQWTDGTDAWIANYGAGGGSGGTSFEPSQGGNGGSAAEYKTGTVYLWPGTVITMYVGQGGVSPVGQNIYVTDGGAGAPGRIRLVVGSSVTYEQGTAGSYFEFTVPSRFGYDP